MTTGTSNPPYSVFGEKDSANSSVTLQYQSITCMPQYRGNSFEVSNLDPFYRSDRRTFSFFYIPGFISVLFSFPETCSSMLTLILGVARARLPAKSKDCRLQRFRTIGVRYHDTALRRPKFIWTTCPAATSKSHLWIIW